MFDGPGFVYAAVAAIVVAVAAFVVRAVRLTNASLALGARHVDLTNPDVSRSFVSQLRAADLPCPRCSQETFALLGTHNRYKCDSCNFEFEGPSHIPRAEPQNIPLHPS